MSAAQLGTGVPANPVDLDREHGGATATHFVVDADPRAEPRVGAVQGVADVAGCRDAETPGEPLALDGHRTSVPGGTRAVAGVALCRAEAVAGTHRHQVGERNRGLLQWAVRAERGLRGCDRGWCDFDVKGRRGWIEAAHLWGVALNETVED